jgi:hypothetical protein
MENTTETGILPSTTVDRVCAARDAALSRMKEAIANLTRGHMLAQEAAELGVHAHGPHNFYFQDRSKDADYGRLFASLDPARSLDIYRQHLDARVWTHLLHMTGMSSLMDRTAKEQFDNSLAGTVPEVTRDNVHATFEALLGDANLIFQRGLARAFSSLDRRFKSHDAFKIGSRIVLTNVFDSWGHVSYGSRVSESITDIERVLSVLAGDTTPVGSLMQKIRDDRANGGMSPHQSVTETPYLRVRAFKNGNAHLWFLRDDLVEKANQVLAAYYGEVLPDAAPGTKEREADLKSKSGLPSKDLAFYATPEAVVRNVLRDAGIHFDYEPKKYRVLEPSAGTGNIAAVIAASGVAVDCIEIDPCRAAEIKRRVPSASVLTANFLNMRPTPIYTHVIMNPPFYGTHWIEHVVHAFDFLAPGGTLVAILPISAELGETSKHVAFREWASKHTSWNGQLVFRDLPPESFASSGTRVSTCHLTLHAKG